MNSQATKSGRSKWHVILGSSRVSRVSGGPDSPSIKPVATERSPHGTLPSRRRSVSHNRSGIDTSQSPSYSPPVPLSRQTSYTSNTATPGSNLPQVSRRNSHSRGSTQVTVTTTRTYECPLPPAHPPLSRTSSCTSHPGQECCIEMTENGHKVHRIRSYSKDRESEHKNGVNNVSLYAESQSIQAKRRPSSCRSNSRNIRPQDERNSNEADRGRRSSSSSFKATDHTVAGVTGNDNRAPSHTSVRPSMSRHTSSDSRILENKEHPPYHQVNARQYFESRTQRPQVKAYSASPQRYEDSGTYTQSRPSLNPLTSVNAPKIVSERLVRTSPSTNFNPDTMDIVRFKPNLQGHGPGSAYSFEIRPKRIYTSIDDIMITSPYHFPQEEAGKIVWRAACPHTDGTGDPAKCKTLHYPTDPSSIRYDTIENTDITDYNVCKIPPDHPSVKEVKLDFDVESFHDTVCAKEAMQMRMAREYSVWSLSSGGAATLTAENVLYSLEMSLNSLRSDLEYHKKKLAGLEDLEKRFRQASRSIQHSTGVLEKLKYSRDTRSEPTEPTELSTMLNRFQKNFHDTTGYTKSAISTLLSTISNRPYKNSGITRKKSVSFNDNKTTTDIRYSVDGKPIIRSTVSPLDPEFASVNTTETSNVSKTPGAEFRNDQMESYCDKALTKASSLARVQEESGVILTRGIEEMMRFESELRGHLIGVATSMEGVQNHVDSYKHFTENDMKGWLTKEEQRLATTESQAKQLRWALTH
ncbi:uncharacterized protein IL334_000712 [Kwoniella shivajii]|uniref:Uncharacterized protein n=1 Tax=Kwoniella shivajii TaxID=564305 RepID=A0ABZ1CPX0_9TREE|nr:hypothetical protein IL334_000712 [Kwoniella shivajii]